MRVDWNRGRFPQVDEVTKKVRLADTTADGFAFLCGIDMLGAQRLKPRVNSDLSARLRTPANQERVCWGPR